MPGINSTLDQIPIHLPLLLEHQLKVGEASTNLGEPRTAIPVMVAS